MEDELQRLGAMHNASQHDCPAPPSEAPRPVQVLGGARDSVARLLTMQLKLPELKSVYLFARSCGVEDGCANQQEAPGLYRGTGVRLQARSVGEELQ